MKTIRFRAGTCRLASAGLLLWLCAFAEGAKDPYAQYEYEVRSDHMTSFTQRDEWRASQAQDKGDASVRKALGKKRKERGDLMEQYGMTWKEAEAYQAYKEYRQMREEIAKQRGFAKDERNEASDDVYQGAGSYGNSQYKDAAAQNVNAAESRARDLYNQSRQLDQMWRAAGYDKVYGPLTDSDQHPIWRTDGSRTDLVESKLFQNRLDPDDQKFTDWVRSQPADLANAIRDLPPGEYTDQLRQRWENGEYRRVAESLRILEETHDFATLKDENGNYVAGTLTGRSAEYAEWKRSQEEKAEAENEAETTAADDPAKTKTGDLTGAEPDATTETTDDESAGDDGETTTEGDATTAETATEGGETPATTETITEPETTENPAPDEPAVETGRDREPKSGTDEGEIEDAGSSQPGDDDGQETEADDDGEAKDDGSAPAGDAETDKPGETTTSSGYVEDSNGRITLTETRDANGNVVRTGTVETDKDGKVTGKTTYEGGTGEGQTTGADNDLRGAEPESDADVSPEAAADGVNTSDSFANNWSQGQSQRGADGNATLAQNSQLGEAANAGNQTIRDADAVADAGGRDAQTIRDASTRATVKSDRENSWGKALGDAVEQGITEGGKAFGEALGGAAADEAVGKIFGTSKGDEDSGAGAAGETEAGAASPTDAAAGTATATSGKDGGKKDDRDEDDDDECDNGDSNSGGKSDDPLGVTGKTKNKDGTVTIRYGCGYSWTGKPPGPSRCPICSRETVSTEENETPDAGATDSGGPGTSGPSAPDDSDLEPPPPGYSGDTGSAPADDGDVEPPTDDIDCPFAAPTEKAD